MTTQATGELRREPDGLGAVRFERLYEASPDELWSALTSPERLRGWLAEAARFELRLGGEIELRFAPGEDDVTRGRITALEPGRLLEYSWGWQNEVESVVRFELVQHEQGTLLILDHRRLPWDAAIGYGAGWEAHLEALQALLAGGVTADAETWHARYLELRPVYDRQGRLLEEAERDDSPVT